MARRCSVTGKGVLVGNNVSHANNKTKRRFLPNLQKATLLSDALGESISLRLTTKGLRTIEHKGGLDAFLMGASNADLDKKTLRFKKRVALAVDQK
ncbi:MAG: 50S ribosomal protein L28 [Alphaproteobacteria bacterium]|nr:50S ribosomal protein L28 [Alphaproteobacteria bacterium]